MTTTTKDNPMENKLIPWSPWRVEDGRIVLGGANPLLTAADKLRHHVAVEDAKETITNCSSRHVLIEPDVFAPFEGPVVNEDGKQLFRDYSGSYCCSWQPHEFMEHAPHAPDFKAVTLSDLCRDLFAAIDACPGLRFLLSTKRIEDARRMWLSMPPRVQCAEDGCDTPGETCPQHPDACHVKWDYRRNLYLGLRASTQDELNSGVPHLLKCRDLSPLLWLDLTPGERLDMRRISNQLEGYDSLGNFWDYSCENHCTWRGFESELVHDPDQSDRDADESGVRWVCPECLSDSALVERDDLSPKIGLVTLSGHPCQPADLAHVRGVIDQCRAASVPVYVRSLGSSPFERTESGPQAIEKSSPLFKLKGYIESVTVETEYELKAPNGGDPLEWPAEFRVQELPEIM